MQFLYELICSFAVMVMLFLVLWGLSSSSPKK